ncbi:hypothetical protein D3C80_2014340 [compost metagenome]
MRCSGFIAATRSANPGESAAIFWKTVPMAAGDSRLTRMLNRPHSCAALRVRPRRADLVML